MFSKNVFEVLVTFFSLFVAINDFSKSVSEIEEVLGINNETNVKSNRSSLVIENELNRLRQMLDFAQDIQLVNEKTSVYIHGQHKAITEDLNIEDAPEVTCEGYDEIVNLIRDQKNFSDDWDDDSDNDSFLSAAESIEIQVCPFFLTFIYFCLLVCRSYQCKKCFNFSGLSRRYCNTGNESKRVNWKTLVYIILSKVFLLRN